MYLHGCKQPTVSCEHAILISCGGNCRNQASRVPPNAGLPRICLMEQILLMNRAKTGPPVAYSQKPSSSSGSFFSANVPRERGVVTCFIPVFY